MSLSMELVDEFWSISHKLKQLDHIIFTSVKVATLRLNFRSYVDDTISVRINRRLAEESSSFSLFL